MTISARCPGTLSLAVLAGAFLAVQPVHAETLASTNADNRLLPAFDVPDAALAEFMPEGWSAAPFSGGPFAGGLTCSLSSSTPTASSTQKAGRCTVGAIAAWPSRRRRRPRARTSPAPWSCMSISPTPAINPYKNSVGAEITRQVVSTGTGGDAASTRQS